MARKPLDTPSMAVQCRNIEFAFDPKKPVLEKLCLNVPQSSIYSLLGASSSGKTTLIKVMTGTIRPHKGEVAVFGQALGSSECSVPGIGIGYMPQELALYPHFSIESTLRYFAQINQMPHKRIAERIKFLKEYLELPDSDRIIARLSGGQQRRVSLAVALIHSPPLLILDEPTVGIDPLLRYKIWSYLQELKQQGHTIIVTTHYISETVISDYIGYVRNGHLLCEECPQKLIRVSESSDLEEALFKLCWQQNKEPGRERISIECIPLKPLNTTLTLKHDMTPAPKLKRCATSRRIFSTVIRRTWNLLVADKLNLFLMLVYPSIIIYMISLSFSKLPSVDVVVVNRDLVEPNNMSVANQLVESLTESVYVKHVNSSEEMTSLILSGKSMAGVTFFENFTECFEQRLHDGMLASEEVLDCAQIRLHVDTTHFIRVWLLVFSFIASFKQVVLAHLPRIGINPQTLLPPIDFLDAGTGNEAKLEFAFESFFVSGNIAGVNFLLSFLMSGLVWLKDRQHGIFERSQVHRVSQYQFFLAHFLVQALIMAISNVSLLLVSVWLFGLEVSSSLVAAYALLYLQSVSSILLGQLLAITSSCHMTYLTKMAMVTFPCFFVSGILWPTSAIQNPLLEMATKVFPLTRPANALRALLSRHLPLTSPQVFGGFLTLIAYIILPLIICTVRLWR